MNIQARVLKVSGLLDLADSQSASSLVSYVRACEVLHAGYSRTTHGRVEDYMSLVSATSKKLGRPRCRDTFFAGWRVGLALKDGRVTREDLLKCSSRRGMHRLIPSRKPRKGHVAQEWTTVRVSVRAHAELRRLAKVHGETLDKVVECLLGLRAREQEAA
jgi:hypothetical protein